ncbi:hypothetical protein OQA88_6609 [Cercophora sp. LCS_1]
MKPTHLLTSCTAALAASLPNPNPEPQEHRIPTSYESAILGRRILSLTPLAVLSTIFPGNEPSATENRPPSTAGMPHGLMEYIADCESSGNPTILAISIETSFKNVAAGSNVSVAVQWMPPHPPAKRIKSSSSSWKSWFSSSSDDEKVADPSSYSAANLPRFSLLGYIERIGDGKGTDEVKSCFVQTHPDAKYWLPGNRIHRSNFVRLVVTEVYWIGGFGDRAYIGWIPVEEWNKVTKEEVEAVKLPGEKKGWNEWSYQGVDL